MRTDDNKRRSRSTLRRVTRAAAVQRALGALEQWTILDDDGSIVAQSEPPAALEPSFPVEADGVRRGAVAGPQAAAVAGLLGALVEAEARQQTLGREALHRYKELTLLYDFSEQISVSMSPAQVADLVAHKASSLVRDSALQVLIRQDSQLRPLARRGGETVQTPELVAAIERVANTGEVQVLDEPQGGSLIAPIRTAASVLGVLWVGPTPGVRYGSEEVKLCCMLGLQAGHAIENARQSAELRAHRDHLEDLVVERTRRLEEALEAVQKAREAELEYLAQVDVLTEAAASVEARGFQPERLASVAERPDALGQLARVFGAMAREVVLREQRLAARIERLKMDIAEQRSAARRTTHPFVPIDRRIALAMGRTLPEMARGAALFTDITGYTRTAEALAEQLGPDAGAEELVRQLNRTLTLLIEEVHRHGGAVIGFAGDGITCWFDDVMCGVVAEHPGSLRARAAASAMRRALSDSAGSTLFTQKKSVVAAGEARRYLVGDPEIQRIDVLVGSPFDRLALGEKLPEPGEILVEVGPGHPGPRKEIEGLFFAPLDPSAHPQALQAWPDLGSLAAGSRSGGDLYDEWILPPVRQRLAEGQVGYLDELRDATALFFRFRGVADGTQLDQTVRWIQGVGAHHGGDVIQLSTMAQGFFVYLGFGALSPCTHDASAAVRAAMELMQPPRHLAFLRDLSIGIGRGTLRLGTYGSASRCAVGLQGDETNTAARLMAAGHGEILCSEAVYDAARLHLGFEALPPLALKGKAQAHQAYRPVRDQRVDLAGLPTRQLDTLKIASVLGESFDAAEIRDLHGETDPQAMDATLGGLEQAGFLIHSGGVWAFASRQVRHAAYDLLLLAQRRLLHLQVAERLQGLTDLDAGLLPTLAYHWERAGQPQRAAAALERASAVAHQRGDLGQALALAERAERLAAERT